MSEMTYDEALGLMTNIAELKSAMDGLSELEAALSIPPINPNPLDIAESQNLPEGAEAVAFEFLGKVTKKELRKRRVQRSKMLIAAGLSPQERRKVYRLEKRKGPDATAKLDAIYADLRTAPSG